MQKLNLIWVMALLLFIGGCQTGPSFNQEGVMIVEAETFELVNAPIIEDPQASESKAVSIVAKDSRGILMINLSAGNYIVNTIIFTLDVDHNALYIQYNEEEELRVYCNIYNQYAYCKKFLMFTVETEGLHKISFRASEAGMKLDCFEIVQAEFWQNPLE